MGNSLDQDIQGRVVFFREDALRVNADEHPARAEAGFGCSPVTAGSALAVTFLSDGEKARMSGYDVARLATEEEAERWLTHAREHGYIEE